MAYYVDISGVSDADLEFLGYFAVEKDGNFAFYVNKGEHYLVHKSGSKSFLHVDDPNDAAILRGRHKLPAPPYKYLVKAKIDP